MILTDEQRTLVDKILSEPGTEPKGHLDAVMQDPTRMKNYIPFKDNSALQYELLCAIYNDSSAFHRKEIDDRAFVAAVNEAPLHRAYEGQLVDMDRQTLQINTVVRAFVQMQKLKELGIIHTPTLSGIADEIVKRWESANGFPEAYSEEGVDDKKLLICGINLIAMLVKQPALFVRLITHSHYAGLATHRAYTYTNKTR